MDEIREVEAELRRLREDARHYKTEAETIKKEKRTLESKNEYLVNKLKEASYVYGEAGKRLLYFINNQVNPVTKRLNDIDAMNRKLGAQDKALGGSIATVEKTAREDFATVDKRLKALGENLTATHGKINTAIKASVRKGEKDDLQVEKKLEKAMADFDSAMRSLKISIDRKISTKSNLLEKKTDTKMDALREHNLIVGKDIEALKKFEGDIQDLEGKLHTTISNLTQTRIDMEKLAQRVKGEMAKTKTVVNQELTKLTNDVNTKLLEFSSELKQADEKNVGDMKLAIKKNQTELGKELHSMAVDMDSFRKSINSKLSSGQAALRKEQSTFGGEIEKRLGIFETEVAANAKNQKEAERIFNGKILDIVSHADAADEKMGTLQLELTEHLENFKDVTKRREIVLKNELGKLSKTVDQKVGSASMGADKKIGLVAKDVESLMAMQPRIASLEEDVIKRKEENAALSSRIKAVLHELKDKSDKDYIKMGKQLDLMKSEINNGMEATEARISEDSMKSFSTARHSLKKDIHSLREENAAMKAEIKNLRGLVGVVDDLQQAVTATQVKVDGTVNDVEKISAKVSADVDKQALKVSKDMAGISSALKADLKDIIAREKERFASQSAELDAKYSAISKKSDTLTTQSSGNRQTSVANKKKLVLLDRKIDRLMGEIVNLKKEYKIEMGRLLKELEG